MKDWQKRVVSEKEELDEKTETLLHFINSEVFSDLPNQPRKLLREQMYIMLEYSKVLADRIITFG